MSYRGRVGLIEFEAMGLAGYIVGEMYSDMLGDDSKPNDDGE